MTDTFISYSRKDIGIAQSIVELLKSNNLKPWLDVDGHIPLGERWPDVIDNAIEGTASLLVIVTPAVFESNEVNREIRYAEEHGKPIIIVICSLPSELERNVMGGDRKEIHFDNLPDWIRYRQVVDWRYGDDNIVHEQILQAVRRDHVWWKLHGELLSKARYWSEGKGSLLKGKDLEKAEEWLGNAKQFEGTPTEMHHGYIRASLQSQGKENIARSNQVADLALQGFPDPDFGVALALANVKKNGASTKAILALDRSHRQSHQQEKLLLPDDFGLITHAQSVSGGRLALGVAEFRKNTAILKSVGNQGVCYGASYCAAVLLHFDNKEQVGYCICEAGSKGTSVRALSCKGIVVSEDGGVIRMGNLISGKNTTLPYALPSGLAAADFDGSGNYMVAADHRGNCWVFDIQGKKPIRELTPQEGGNIFKKKRIAGVNLFNRNSAKGLDCIGPIADDPVCVAMSYDGQYAAISYQLDTVSEHSYQILIYEVSSGKNIWSFSPREACSSLVFNPANNGLCFVTDDLQCYLYSMETETIARITGNVSVLTSVVTFSPNGKYCAVAGRDNYIRIFNLNDFDIIDTLGAHDSNSMMPPCFVDDEKIITGQVNGSLYLWQVNYSGAQSKIDLSWYSPDSSIILRDRGFRKVHGLSSNPEDHTLCVQASYLVSLLFAENTEPKDAINFYPPPASYTEHQLAWLSGKAIVGIRYQGDARFQREILLYTKEDDCYLGEDYISIPGEEESDDPWEATDESLSEEYYYYTRLFLSADKELLVVQIEGYAPRVEIWDTGLLECRETISASGLKAISADSKYLLLLSPNYSCSIYNTHSGKRMSLVGLKESEIHLTAGDPTKNHFAIVSNTEISIVAAETGEVVTHMTGHRMRITSITFSNDGTMVASGGDDGALRVWDAMTGEELRRFDRYMYPVTAVCFSADDKTLISGNANSTVYYWKLWSPKELVEQVEQYARPLTEIEKVRYHLQARDD